jgi:hypothetical protein
MSRNRTVVLTNIVNALANEGSIERNGNVIEGIANQFAYAGVQVSAQALRNAVDAVAEVCPSVFLATQPVVSTHYGPWGMEYRVRPSDEVRTATRACIDAVYAVTDTMDRTPTTITVKGQDLSIETIRPRAFAIAMGHLRIRWAKGDFSVPPATTIQKWVGINA